MFGDCTSCDGLVAQSGSGQATASDLMSRFEEFQPSLTAAIVALVPEVEALSFSSRDSTSFLADVTLSPGVVETDRAYNQIVYYMAQIFDLYPGTIIWETVPASGKRTAEQIVVHFYNELEPSSSSNTVVPVFVFGFLACIFQLL